MSKNFIYDGVNRRRHISINIFGYVIELYGRKHLRPDVKDFL